MGLIVSCQHPAILTCTPASANHLLQVAAADDVVIGLCTGKVSSDRAAAAAVAAAAAAAVVVVVVVADSEFAGRAGKEIMN